MVEHSTADREVTGSIPVAPLDWLIFSRLLPNYKSGSRSMCLVNHGVVFWLMKTEEYALLSH